MQRFHGKQRQQTYSAFHDTMMFKIQMALSAQETCDILLTWLCQLFVR